MGEEYYNSKYYSCEEIDRRLFQGTYDDAVAKGYKGTKEEFDTLLASIPNKFTKLSTEIENISKQIGNIGSVLDEINAEEL